MTEWIALFCPHCGCTVNENDLENDHGYGHPKPDYGSLYTCGWCKTRTRDWNHVIECRRTWETRQRLRHEAARQDLVEMLDEMDAEYGASSPEEVAEIEAIFNS